MTSLLCSSLIRSIPRSSLAFASANSSSLHMCRYIGNMSDKHPGLVLHMLDVLDVITNYADSEAEYVARAQDIYLGQTFISNLGECAELILSPASALALLKQVTQDLRPFALQSQKNRSFYGRLCLL